MQRVKKVNEFFVSDGTEFIPEELVVFGATLFLITCPGILLFGYILKGREIVQMKFFNVIILVGVIDAIMMLIFPEITVAIIRAVLLAE